MAKQLVFVNKSMFNELIGWRHHAQAFIGQAARYRASRTRGKSWSVLPVYTTEGYLPYTGFRHGWFNEEAFFRWIIDELLPYYNAYPALKNIIVMDNASFYYHPRIKEVIREYGCQVSNYLILYIQLTIRYDFSFLILRIST